MKHLQHEFPVNSLLIANVPQRFPATGVIDAELLQHAGRFGVVDDPIGDGGVEIAEYFGDFFNHEQTLPAWRE